MRLLNPNMPRLRAVRPSGGSRTSRVHSGGNSLPTTEIMPVLERKIHPDIMLRAEKFVALHNREGNQNEEALPERSESSVLDIADFMRLEPSERNCPSCREVNDQDNSRPLVVQNQNRGANPSYKQLASISQKYFSRETLQAPVYLALCIQSHTS